MSTYRQIERNLWSDERVRTLEPLAKLLWIYLLSNQQDHYTGIYTLSLNLAAECLGVDVDSLSLLLASLDATGLIRWDERARVVWIRGMFRHQCGDKPSKRYVSGAERWVKTLPRTNLKEEFCSHYQDLLGDEIVMAMGLHERGMGAIGSVPSRFGSDRFGSVARVADPASEPEQSETEPTPDLPPPQPTVRTREALDRDSATAVSLLAEGLVYGLADGTKAPTPPAGHRSLRPPAGLLLELFAALLLEPGSTPRGCVAEVLGTLERWARRVDRGSADASTWRHGVLLSPNGYARCLAELGGVGPPAAADRRKREADAEAERKRAEDEQRSRRQREIDDAEKLAAPLLRRLEEST